MWADLTTIGIPLPDVTERELAPFWEGTRAGELRVQRSVTTGKLQWPPRGSAIGRADFELDWVAVPGAGTLFTWTVVAQTVLPGYSSITPYATGVIELPGLGIRVAGFIDEDPATLVADETLVVAFIPLNEHVTLPIWRRA